MKLVKSKIGCRGGYVGNDRAASIIFDMHDGRIVIFNPGHEVDMGSDVFSLNDDGFGLTCRAVCVHDRIGQGCVRRKGQNNLEGLEIN